MLLAIGEPVRLEWYNPQGERIAPSKRMALHTEASRSRLIIYNAIVEDAGIYRCQAADAGGRTEEASVVLEIYRKPGKLAETNCQISICVRLSVRQTHSCD